MSPHTMKYVSLILERLTSFTVWMENLLKLEFLQSIISLSDLQFSFCMDVEFYAQVLFIWLKKILFYGNEVAEIKNFILDDSWYIDARLMQPLCFSKRQLEKQNSLYFCFQRGVSKRLLSEPRARWLTSRSSSIELITIAGRHPCIKIL